MPGSFCSSIIQCILYMLESFDGERERKEWWQLITVIDLFHEEKPVFKALSVESLMPIIMKWKNKCNQRAGTVLTFFSLFNVCTNTNRKFIAFMRKWMKKKKITQKPKGEGKRIQSKFFTYFHLCRGTTMVRPALTASVKQITANAFTQLATLILIF